MIDKANTKQRAATVEAVAQFVALMHAHERGERSKAAEARDALSRLGVRVRLLKERAQGPKGGES